MSNHIERWMTPWSEEVILSAERALKNGSPRVKPVDIVVNTKNKNIGVVKWIRNDFIIVFVKMCVYGIRGCRVHLPCNIALRKLTSTSPIANNMNRRHRH